MKYCVKCGNELFDEAVVCTSCGCATGHNEPKLTNTFQAQNTDAADIGLCILSFFIPLFGFIYWGTKHKETPKKAQACGITAVVSFVISMLSSMMFIPLLIDLL